MALMNQADEEWWQRQKRVREQLQIKADDLAHAAGISEGYVYTIERGKLLGTPAYHVVRAIAQQLQMTPMELMGDQKIAPEDHEAAGLMGVLKRTDRPIGDVIRFVREWLLLPHPDQDAVWDIQRRVKLYVEASGKPARTLGATVHEEPAEYNAEEKA